MIIIHSSGFCVHSYFSHSRAPRVQLGSRNSPSHGGRTLQPGTDTAGHRKHRRTPGGRLSISAHITQAHTLSLHSCVLYCQFLSAPISSVLYTLTFVAPGSSPAWLALTAARHVVATRTMDTVAPLLAALPEESLRTGFRQKHTSVRGKHTTSEPKDTLLEEVYFLFAWKANCTNCSDAPCYTLSAYIPGASKPFCCCWCPDFSEWSTGA